MAQETEGLLPIGKEPAQPAREAQVFRACRAGPSENFAWQVIFQRGNRNCLPNFYHIFYSFIQEVSVELLTMFLSP